MLTNRQINNFIGIEDLIFIAIACIYIFLCPQILIKSSELGCILSSGSSMLDKASIFPAKIFIFTPINEFWVNSTWLSDIILAFIYQLGSYTLLVIFAALLISLLFTATFRIMLEHYNNWFVNGILLIIGLIACSDFLEINNRLFSFPLAILLINRLDRTLIKGLDNKRVILLLTIIALWANLNTGFLVGLLIIFIYGLSFLIKYFVTKDPWALKRFNGYLLLTIGGVLVSFLNPAGYKAMWMVINYFSSGLYGFNGFLASPDFHQSYPFRYFEVIILVLIFACVFSSYRPPLHKSLLSGVFLLLSLFSAINIPYFIILTLPLISEILGNTDLTFNSEALKKFLSKATICIGHVKILLPVLFAIVMIMIGISVPDLNKQIKLPDTLPIKAVDFIQKNHLKGNVLNPLGWGCFLQHELNCKVFISERMYQNSWKTSDSYNKMISIYKNYSAILDNYKIDWVILPSFERLPLLLDINNDWQKVYDDKEFFIYARKGTFKGKIKS